MKYKNILILFLIISIFLSINMVVAADFGLNNVSDTLNSENSIECIDIESSQSFNDVLTENTEEVIVESADNEDILSDGYVVDVKTTDGVYDIDEDPIFLAVTDINNANVKSATMNIHNGTYVMLPAEYGYDNFENVNELVINGVDGKVIFGLYDDDSGYSMSGSFGFSNSANVTFNNIIFDLSNINSFENSDDLYLTPAIKTGSGSELFVTLNNCTFIGGSNVNLENNFADTNYVNCIFTNFAGNYLFKVLSTSTSTYFENCIFSNVNVTRIGYATYESRNQYDLIFNGVWFGNNDIASSITNYPNIVNIPSFILPVQKYAIFSVHEKYLGNNQYEIIGKLTWNGTDSSEGMENFPPMTVTLTSTTGEIQNVTLVNGNFKAIYTSESSEHKVAAKLDSEEQNLTFANIALNLNAPIITYGENQNIVVNLSKPVTGIVTVTVNGKNYPVNIDNSDSITVPIDDTLNVGTHDVNVTFIDEENHIYGFNTIKITISPIKIKTNITIPEIVAGKATTTTITLPQNATGNVTVIVDGNISSVENLTNGSATVTIPELSAGKHNVTISYSGDANYAGFAQTSAVEVKEPAKPTTQPDDQKPATTKKTATKITAKKKTFKAKTKVKKYTITLKAGKKAVKKVQVILKIGKKIFKAKTNAKGKATFKIKKLTKKGKYNAKITFKGNKLYKASSKKVKITVKK